MKRCVIRAFGMAFVLVGAVGFCRSVCEAQQIATNTQAAGHGFAAVSLKPSAGDGPIQFGPTATGYRARNTPILWVIMQAYYPQSMAYWRKERVVDAPGWVQSVRFDVEAKLDDREIEGFAKLTDEGKANVLAPYLQAMLRERCMLQITAGQKPGKYYALILDKRGLKIDKTAQAIVGGIPLPDGGSYKPTYVEATKQHALALSGVTMSDFATVLTGLTGEDGLPIQDETGLGGRYSFTLLPLDVQSGADAPTGNSPGTRWDIGALGLRLKHKVGDLPSLTVVSIEGPGGN